MRDDLMRLDAKTKMCGRILQPVLNCGFFDELPESEIHFDRIQLGRVVAEEFLLRQLFRIKVGLPCRIGPSRRSYEELRHKIRSRLGRGRCIAGRRARFTQTRDYTLLAFFRAELLRAGFVLRPAFRGRAESFWAAISLRSGSFSAAMAFRSGSFCFNVITGANKSPIFSTREITCGASNTSRLASFFLNVRSTSSQVTGVETVGCSRARSEKTATVVLCSSFWLQSTNTLPVRR